MLITLRNPRFLIGAAIGLACLILYSITMAPDIGAHDLSEWQATGYTLGIAHAPGSPAYTIIGYLFALIPLGLPAARVTYVSVVVGATGVVATYVFVLLLFDHLLPALASAATLAVAGMWWGHASVATPYNGVITIMAILLVLLLLWSKSGNVRFLWGGALLAGIGLAYHPILMFFLPVPLAGIFLLGPWRSLLRPKPGLFLALFFLAGLSVYLYLPIRSATGPAIMAEKIDSLSKFMSFVSASHARETKLRESALPGWPEIGDRLSEVVYKSYFPPFISVTFAPAILLFYPGIGRRLRKIWRWLVLLGAGAVVHLFLTFVLSDIYAHYYLPLLFYFSFWAGFAVYLLKLACDIAVRKNQTRNLALIIAGVSYGALLTAGLPQAWDFANHSGDRTMRTYVDYAFARAKPGALILASWESYTGLLYAQEIEGQRPDVKVRSVSEQDQKNLLPEIKATNPSAQILLSVSYNIHNLDDSKTYGGPGTYPLSIKALTYRDYLHGEPYPVATQLREAK